VRPVDFLDWTTPSLPDSVFDAGKDGRLAGFVEGVFTLRRKE